MTRQKFMESINGKTFRFTRIRLASGKITDDTTIVPSDLIEDEQISSILLNHCFHYYDDSDLFTCDDGIYVAVVRSGAGHLWCDRFETESPS